jgi:hypothetical protein
LKHFSLIDEAAVLLRHTRDENPTTKAHERETEKHKVKFMEALKLVHFQVSPCIFFLHFQLTLAF